MTQQDTSLPNQSTEGMDALHMSLARSSGAWLTNTASHCGCIAVVKFLAGRLPFTVNARENYGNSRLLNAVTGGHTDVVRFLLSVGANPDIHIENQEQSSLFEAATSGQLEIVKVLPDNGANPDPRLPIHALGVDRRTRRCQTQKQSLRILQAAAESGHTAVVELLLEHIDIQRFMAGTVRSQDRLIVTAACCGLASIVRQMLDMKAYGHSNQPHG